MPRRAEQKHFVVSDEPGKTNSGVERRLITYACGMTRPVRWYDTEDRDRVSCPKCSQAIWKRELTGYGERIRIEREENKTFTSRVRSLQRITVDGDLVGWAVFENGYGGSWYLAPVDAWLDRNEVMVVAPSTRDRYTNTSYKSVATGHSREEVAFKAVGLYDNETLVGERLARAKANAALAEFKANQAARRAALAAQKETLS